MFFSSAVHVVHILFIFTNCCLCSLTFFPPILFLFLKKIGLVVICWCEPHQQKLDLCMQHWNQSCWHNNCLFNYFICYVQSNGHFLSLSFVAFLGTSPLLLSSSSPARQWEQLYFYTFCTTHWITIAAGKRQLPHTPIIKRNNTHTQISYTIIMWCESNRRQKYMVENFDGNVVVVFFFGCCSREVGWKWKMFLRNNAGICGGKNNASFNVGSFVNETTRFIDSRRANSIFWLYTFVSCGWHFN